MVLPTRADTPVVSNPVPRGLPARRNRRELRGAPLVRGVRRLPRILDPSEAAMLLDALRTHRDRAIVEAMLLGGLRRNEALGLRLEDLRLGECRVFVAEGKGGHQRLVPMSPTFFATAAAYPECERPLYVPTDRPFVVWKGPRRGQALSSEGLDEIVSGPRKRAGRVHGTCHELRHTCLTRLREAGMSLEALQAQAGHRPSRRRRSTRTSGPIGWPLSTRLPQRCSSPSSRSRPWHERRTSLQRGAPASDQHRVSPGRPATPPTWPEIAARAPGLASTMAKYLAQIAVSSRPGTVEAADLALRVLAGHLVEADVPCVRVADVARSHIESFKLALAARPGRRGHGSSVGTVRHKLGLVRTFFERIIEWEYDDAPRRVPVFAGDFPKADEPLPPSLDDPVAAKFMAALAEDPNRRRRLIVELLAAHGHAGR